MLTCPVQDHFAANKKEAITLKYIGTFLKKLSSFVKSSQLYLFHFCRPWTVSGCWWAVVNADPTYMVRAIPSNASDNVYCTLLAHSAMHGAMAGYTGFTVGPVNGRHAYIPIEVSFNKRTVRLHCLAHTIFTARRLLFRIVFIKSYKRESMFSCRSTYSSIVQSQNWRLVAS